MHLLAHFEYRMISKTYHVFQYIEKAYITNIHLFLYLFIHLFMKIEPSTEQNIISIRHLLTSYTILWSQHVSHLNIGSK